MAIATLADLFTPDIWIPGMRERQATRPALMNSGIVTTTPEFNTLAAGGGISVNVPFYKDITAQVDEIQVEDTAPTTINGITTGLQVAPMLNRVTKNAATALSGGVSGTDPVAEMIDQLADRRLKQRQTTIINILRGLFGSGGARNGAGCLSGVRLGGTTAERFDEAGETPSDDNLISPDMFIDAKTLLGELEDLLVGGAFLCHPNVKARLEKLDALNFKTGVPSDLPFKITTYRGVPLFTSSALVRAGTTSGYVYDSYLISRGAIAYGEKPQNNVIGEVSSLVLDGDADKNNQFIYDRTRFLALLSGTKWGGSPAGQSATNAELATVGNWTLVFTSADRCGAVCFRTNG